ncbi:hypothetical protein T492DRAFT_127075 [Pavlovales sp. CCMP2436]|nr:hypothetical protein T492DRAFT_127075 [Pavlovales sp. CCMP2436]|mmetsp:Transcript_9947/g.23952  ORF Transcript_9947/g.23952 Transcript_9947/m.23952 type:complete len:274 (+) Transcript_9947:109-930(+)
MSTALATNRAMATQQLMLVALPSDDLESVLALLSADDELAVSLACCRLRDAVASVQSTKGHSPKKGSIPKCQTRYKLVVGSVPKLLWALSCGLTLNLKLCQQAVKFGTLEVLQWLRVHGCPRDPGMDYLHSAWKDHLPALEWLVATGAEEPDQIYMYAAGGGQMEVLKWAHAIGVPRSFAGDDGFIGEGNACAIAAAEGHLSCLKWLRAHGLRLMASAHEWSHAIGFIVLMNGAMRWRRRIYRRVEPDSWFIPRSKGPDRGAEEGTRCRASCD